MNKKSPLPEFLTYVGLPCEKCGRYRVQCFTDGHLICEKCWWSPTHGGRVREEDWVLEQAIVVLPEGSGTRSRATYVKRSFQEWLDQIAPDSSGTAWQAFQAGWYAHKNQLRDPHRPACSSCGQRHGMECQDHEGPVGGLDGCELIVCAACLPNHLASHLDEERRS